MKTDAVREALAVLSAQVEREIAEHPISAWHWKDHACAECVPGGDLVQVGFRCARHAALALLSPTASPDATPAATCDLCFHPKAEHVDKCAHCSCPRIYVATPAAKPDAPSADDANAANVRRLLAQGEAEQRGNARYEKRGTPDTFAMPKPDAPGGCIGGTQHAPNAKGVCVDCGATTPPPSPTETGRDRAEDMIAQLRAGASIVGTDAAAYWQGAAESLVKMWAARDAELAKVREEADNIHALWESTDLLARKQTGEIASLRSEAKLLSKQRDYFAGQRATTETELAKVRAENAALWDARWPDPPCFACKASIRHDSEAFRCWDCGERFHRDCLRLHCGDDLTEARKQRDAAEARATEAERERDNKDAELAMARNDTALAERKRDAAESQLAAERRRVEEAAPDARTLELAERVRRLDLSCSEGHEIADYIERAARILSTPAAVATEESSARDQGRET